MDLRALQISFVSRKGGEVLKQNAIIIQAQSEISSSYEFMSQVLSFITDYLQRSNQKFVEL